MRMQRKFKGFEREDGTLAKLAFFDGYNFGDRLLEGCKFCARIEEDGTMTITVCESCKGYLAGLDAKKWLREALQYAQQCDIFAEAEEGGDDLVLLPA
jgi:hypothetical protein